MTTARQQVVITGQGAVSALGWGVDALWDALSHGRDGLRPIERFPTEGFSTHLGGMVASPVRLGVKGQPSALQLCESLAVTAAREALAMAGLGAVDPTRVALVMGTSIGTDTEGLHALAERVASLLRVEGPRLIVSTACSSSTNALGFGKDLLDEGYADVVLAGGADVLTPEIFAGFHALGLLSTGKCAPFSEAIGTTLGEGAGFLVLERADDAATRRAKVIAVLSGYGLSCDGYHATSPDPSGAGVARAIRGALEDAGVAPGAVSYLNAHGTGTAANDPAEWRAITQVFGDRAATLPVSSTKSSLGHAQGAAGVLELIATLLCLERGLVPPTLHFTRPRPRGPVDPIAQTTPRPCIVEHAVCTNSAFGGANAAVVVSRSLGAPRVARHRAVYVAGLGVVGPFRAQAKGVRGPQELLAAHVPTADPRGLDPSECWLTAAVALALADAGLVPKGVARDRIGLIAGALNSSPTSWSEFRASIESRGLPKLSAHAFTRLVLNASAGTASRLLGLRGPTSAVTCGAGSGLLALVLSALHLAGRDDADQLVVCGVDEVDQSRTSAAIDGAASLVLTTTPSAVRITGWALAGPGQLEQASDAARAMAGVADPLPAWPVVEGALVTGSLRSCAQAVHALRTGTVPRALVAETSASATCAVILEGVTR